MRRGSSQWMQWCCVSLPLLLILPYSKPALTSHSLRHHQHGGPTKDDGDSIAGNKNATTLDFNESLTTLPTPPPPPVERTVRLHQETQLECNIATEVRTNPTWRHGDQLIVDSTTAHALAHRYARDPSSGALHIANVRLEDGGLWQCEERDPVTGRVKAAARAILLVVTEPPRAPYLEVDGRRLDPGNVFLPVTEGAALSVCCVVEGGHPAPRLAWSLSLASQTPPPVLNTSSTEAAHQHVRSEARLDRVMREHHNATVSCLVHHATLGATLNASLLLDVQYSPSFAISRVPGFGFPITEGIPVSLKCDVDSNPPSSPVWVKDDGPPPVAQSGDGYLNFTAIRREHIGWYKCTSRGFSSIGYFLNVRYEEGPEVTQEPSPGEPASTGRQLEVALGGAVQLHCPAGGASCWSRVGSGGALEPVGAGPELTLERVLYQEAGSYRCMSGPRPQLEEWRAELDVDVVVTGAPAVYPSNKTLTAMTGQQVAISVLYCANPAVNRAMWLTGSTILRPGEMTSALIAHNITPGSSPHCRHAILTLRAVTHEDAGEYVFLVRSPRGIAEGSVTINVTRASSYSASAAGGQHLSSTTVILYLLAMREVLR